MTEESKRVIMTETRMVIWTIITIITALIVITVSVIGLVSGLKNMQTYPSYKVLNYTYAYQTSEVQEYTHDIYLAHCVHDIYIEVPEDHANTYITAKKTDKIIYYRVYDCDFKVSNKGWAMK